MYFKSDLQSKSVILFIALPVIDQIQCNTLVNCTDLLFIAVYIAWVWCTPVDNTCCNVHDVYYYV